MDLPVVVDFTSASLCFSITVVRFTESEENDCRHRGEKALPVMPPSRKAYSPPTRYQWWPQCLIFIALQTCCEVSLCSFKFIRDNGAICNAHISAKTSVILRISQKTRQHNGFINYAVMQIREDELQILCDKVWSTAGFFDNLSSEGSCCCCHGGLSPSFVACPAINDAVIFLEPPPPPHPVFASFYVFCKWLFVHACIFLYRAPRGYALNLYSVMRWGSGNDGEFVSMHHLP